MRFRRSVRIIKGVKLNFSGSGVSLSVGMRGLNYTIGKNWTYWHLYIVAVGLFFLYSKTIFSNEASSKKRKDVRRLLRIIDDLINMLTKIGFDCKYDLDKKEQLTFITKKK